MSNRGRPRKKVNEHFFDGESKQKWYVSGAFYASYVPSSDKPVVVFRSRHRDLVQIVRNQLGSKHAILSDPNGKSSYSMNIKGAPYLNTQLEKIGLNKPKKQRRFPEHIDEDYISHFIRGFLDAQAYPDYSNGRYTRINVSFNNMFLVGLNQTLRQYAEVERPDPYNDRVIYSGSDSSRIHDLIYDDWDFIEEHGLYLPSKKDIFRTDFSSAGKHKTAAVKRIKRVKELLRQDCSIEKAAQYVGYADISSLCRAFKRVTGKTMREWLKEEKKARALRYK